MSSFDVLWGGSLVSLIFDAVTHSCTAQIEMLDGGVRSIHSLQFISISELRFTNTIKEPWMYAEISEIDAQFDRLANHWLIDMMLWSDEASLVVRCLKVSLNGEFQSNEQISE